MKKNRYDHWVPECENVVAFLLNLSALSLATAMIISLVPMQLRAIDFEVIHPDNIGDDGVGLRDQESAGWISSQISNPIGYFIQGEWPYEELMVYADKNGGIAQKIGLISPYKLQDLGAVGASGVLDRAFPLLVSGSVGGKGNVTEWKMRIEGGDEISMAIYSRRIGSALDPMLEILSSNRVPLQFVDDTGVLGGDFQTLFTPTESGEYTFELRDLEHGGGDKYTFIMCFQKNRDLQQHTVPVLPVEQDDDMEFLRSPSDNRVPPHTFVDRFKNPFDSKSYVFVQSADGPMTFTASTRKEGLPLDLNIALVGSDGKQTGKQTYTETGDSRISLKSLDKGDYRLELSPLPGTEIGTGYFKILIDQAWAGVELASESHLYHLKSKDAEADMKININLDNGYKGKLHFKIDSGQFPNPGLEINQGEVEAGKENATLKLSYSGGLDTKGIFPFQVAAYGEDGSLGHILVSTRNSMKKSGLGNSPKILSKLDGIHFIKID